MTHSESDLRAYVNATVPIFDDPATARREAFEIAAVIVALGVDERRIAELAGYLGLSERSVKVLAVAGAEYRVSPTATLRALVASGVDVQAREYALFLLQVIRLTTLRFGSDPQMLTVASSISAAITRFVPGTNTVLEPPTIVHAGKVEPGEGHDSVTPSTQKSDVAVGTALDELEALVGLDRVKRAVNEQVQLLRISQMRSAAGLKNPTVSRHLVFVGNPGTGKTTVARIIARVYGALGVLPNGQLVETDASGLVAGYVGQTAIKTRERIDEALGGVLFVDEAYALVREGSQFGLEAVDTLVKAMDDHRDRLAVIVAGYPEPMAQFISSNPGLESRFPTTIVFEDYTTEQLVAIFESMCAGSDYVLDPAASPVLIGRLAQAQQSPDFGNAREVRNMFESALRRHAVRLAGETEPSVEQMKTILASDLQEEPD